MQVYGWNEVVAIFIKKHGSANLFLDWKQKAIAANPKNSNELRQQLGHNPDFVNGYWVFDINSFRLIAAIPIDKKTDHGEPPCIVLRVMTHNEYDKWSRQNHRMVL